MIKMRRAFTAPSVAPTMAETRSSFQSTFIISPVSTSPKAKPRTISVLVWLPQLPAVSMSMGIKLTSSGSTEMAAS